MVGLVCYFSCFFFAFFILTNLFHAKIVCHFFYSFRQLFSAILLINNIDAPYEDYLWRLTQRKLSWC